MRKITLSLAVLIFLVASTLPGGAPRGSAQAIPLVESSRAAAVLMYTIYLPAIYKAPPTGEMRFIAAGNFKRGCDSLNNAGMECDISGDEEPLRDVYLNSYWIDKTEVTNGLYAYCVAAGACTVPIDTTSWNRTEGYYFDPTYANYPVIHVTWENANTYCAWAGKRLPTEAEWEKAARGFGEDTRPFPWGDTIPNCDYANFYNDGYCYEDWDTNAVGSYPIGSSPYGVLDMAGNVWEWVSDWYQSDYYSDPSSTVNPTGPASGDYKVFRGGGYYDYYPQLRVAFRNYWIVEFEDDNLGFRCARNH